MKSIPLWLKIGLPIILLILVIGFLAFGWFASSKILSVNNQIVEYDQTIESVSGDSYTISGSIYDSDGIFGGYRSDGSFIGILQPPLDIDYSAEASTRDLPALEGPKPKPDDKISLQGNIWLSNPKQALGIDYEDVKYDSPLGQMDAWLIKSASSKTWTIGVHGIGAPKQELSRFVQPVLGSGSNMMIINYRNDPDNPKSPDGLTHLGGTEWQDLEAAVKYARDNGAESINLYGVSLGGSVVENYLRKSPEVTDSNINKVVLDSPALDWQEILTFRIKQQGFPALAYYPAASVMKLRGVSVSDITTQPQDIKHKTLLIHSAGDSNVPQNASKKLAASRSDLVQFVNFAEAEHTRSWNYDPPRYEQIVTDFLEP